MGSMLTPAEILGPEGRLAARLKTYERRPEQLQMAQAVAEAIDDPHHLIVEAGTGVGKSFAYLVPLILAATNSEEDSDRRPIKRVVVSTHTISLQEQLMSKDLPLLLSKAAVSVRGTEGLRRWRHAPSCSRQPSPYDASRCPPPLGALSA